MLIWLRVHNGVKITAAIPQNQTKESTGGNSTCLMGFQLVAFASSARSHFLSDFLLRFMKESRKCQLSSEFGSQLFMLLVLTR